MSPCCGREKKKGTLSTHTAAAGRAKSNYFFLLEKRREEEKWRKRERVPSLFSFQERRLSSTFWFFLFIGYPPLSFLPLSSQRTLTSFMARKGSVLGVCWKEGPQCLVRERLNTTAVWPQPKKPDRHRRTKGKLRFMGPNPILLLPSFPPPPLLAPRKGGRGRFETTTTSFGKSRGPHFFRERTKTNHPSRIAP